MRNVFSLERLLGLFMLISFSACKDVSEDGNLWGPSGLQLQTRLATESVNAGENTINDLSLLFFKDGKFVKSFNDVVVKEDGSIVVPMTQQSDCVYFLSEYDKVFQGDVPETEKEFLEKMGVAEKTGSAPIFMTGKKDLTSQDKSPVVLTRGVSRVDVDIQAEGIKVTGITLPSAYTSGYLFQEHHSEQVPDEYLQEITKDYSDSPIEKTTEGVLYLYEQKFGEKIPFTINMVKDGEKKSVSGEFPAHLERNKKYSIALVPSGGGVVLEVKMEPWGEGEDTGLYPDITDKILIDPARTVLSYGAYVCATNDTLYLPYWGSDVKLAFSTEHDLECHPDDFSELQVSVLPKGEGFQLEDKFQVVSSLRTINSDKKYVHVGMRLKGRLNDVNQIVITLLDHQIKFGYDKEFTQPFLFTDGVHEWDRYTDGTLCYLQLPKDHRVLEPFVKGRWIRIDDDVEGDTHTLFRVEGGYKPNDVTAKGQVQEATVVIERPTPKEGVTVQETYVFKRRNWGLPVVKINGMYWAKYNLRGNVKNFTDQVQWEEDQALNSIGGQSLKEYLKTRVEWRGIPGWEEWGEFPYFRKDDTTARIYKLMGEGYLGNTPDGMVIQGENATSENYFYEGYKGPSTDINLLPATEMAPDGYQIPSMEHFTSLLPSSLIELKSNSKNPDTQTYTLGGKQVTLEAFPMDYMLENPPGQGFQDIKVGGRYGYIMITFISVEGEKEPLILIGHKPQIKEWSDEKKEEVCKSDCVIFACSSGDGHSFALNGFNGDYKVGIQDLNDITVGLGGNSKKVVKMIRCVKTPVNYIME